jgi:septum formation protein
MSHSLDSCFRFSCCLQKLLQMVGIDPIVRVSNFDESTINADDTLHLVQTLAQCKAQTIAPQFDTGLILGCDSVLEVAGKSMANPRINQKRSNFVGKRCAVRWVHSIQVML